MDCDQYMNNETGEENPNFIYDDDMIISKKDNTIMEYQEALEDWVLLCQKYEKQINEFNIKEEKLMNELFSIKTKLDKTLNVPVNNISYTESYEGSIEPKKKKRKLSKPNNFEQYVGSTFK